MVKKSKSLKRTAVLTVTSGLLFVSLPYATFADTPVSTTSAQFPSANGSTSTNSITQDQAIAAAKAFYSIPSDYVVQYVSYQDANQNLNQSNGVWNIQFGKSMSGNGNGINFRVDAVSGKILSFDVFQPGPNLDDSSLTDQQYQTIATGLIKKLVPSLVDQLKLQSGEQSIPGLMTQGIHTYNFIRMVNGIPFSGNKITIRLNAKGEFVGYNYNWSDNLQFPSATPSISTDQAQAIFSQSLQVALRYNTNSLGMNQQNRNANLVYVPYGGDYLGSLPIISAATGKAIDHTGSEISSVSVPAYTPVTDASTALPTTEVTKDQVLEIVKKYPINLDGYQLNSVNYQAGSINQDPQWDLNYSTNNNQGFLQITVDAKTGELTQFTRPGESSANNQTGAGITLDQAKQTAINWLKSTMPVSAKNFAINPVYFQNPKVSGEYQIQFVMLHDGVPCDAYQTVNVDAKTGEVTNFFSGPVSQQMTFPDKNQAISPDKAKQEYLDNPDLKLSLQYLPVYDSIPGMGQPSKAVLVYTPSIMDAPFKQVDAITGQWVSPYGNAVDPSTITDIKGNWAEKYLSNLYVQGALTAQDNKLYPNQTVTHGDAVRAMVILGRRSYSTSGDQPVFQDVAPTDPNYKYIQQAAQMHMIDTTSHTFRPDDNLTREELAEWIATTLGYQDLTKVPGALTNRFRDLDGVDAVHVNDIAVASDLGLMVGYGGTSFHPHDSVTRAQLAVVLTQLAQRIQQRQPW